MQATLIERKKEILTEILRQTRKVQFDIMPSYHVDHIKDYFYAASLPGSHSARIFWVVSKQEAALPANQAPTTHGEVHYVEISDDEAYYVHSEREI